MTDEQRAKRIHHHMYETCEGIAEHAERIVRLEEENEKLRIYAQWLERYLLDITEYYKDTKFEIEMKRREQGIEVEND